MATPANLKVADDHCLVRFTRDGRYLVVVATSFVTVWDMASQVVARKYTIDRRPHSIAFADVTVSADATVLGYVGADSRIHLIDALTGQERLAVVIPVQVDIREASVRISPDGRRLGWTCAGYGGIVNVDTGQSIGLAEEAAENVGHIVDFSPTGRYALFGTDAHSKVATIIVDTMSGRPTRCLPRDTHQTIAFAGTDTQVIVIAQWSLRIYDLPSSQVILRLDGHTGGPAGACFTSDRSRIISYSWRGDVRIWEAGSGRETIGIQSDAPIADLTVSAGGRRLALSCHDGTVRIHTIADWTTSRREPGQPTHRDEPPPGRTARSDRACSALAIHPPIASSA
jgi:WD40 repeat protein